MRSFVASSLLVAGLVASGCQSTSRPRAPANNTPPVNNVPFWVQPEKGRSPLLNTPTTRGNGGVQLTSADQPNVNGILSGRLVDNSGRRLAKAYVQVQMVGSEASARPIELAADENGYFLIPGLTPGRNYRLTARAQEGTRTLAGSVQVSPPNPRVMIRLSEDLVSPEGPVLNGASGPTGGSVPTGGSPPPPPLPDGPGLDRTRVDDGGWVPASPTPAPAAAPAPPTPRDRAPAPPLLPTPPSFENITDRGPDTRTPPRVNVPSPTGSNIPEPDPIPSGRDAGPSDPSTRRLGPTPIPSCEMAGPRRVRNFALYDIDGQPWEFQQRHGRLILLDFWGTWCAPCLRALPEIRLLQSRYSNAGLEVVGIACEGSTEAADVRHVADVARKNNLNYRVLVTESKTSPVVARFDIRVYPTLILLDQDGSEVFRGTADQIRTVEGIIRQRLGVR